MGRSRVGAAPRASGKGCKEGCTCGRHTGNAGSFDKNRGNLDAGADTRYRRLYPLPSLGDRFGRLTIVGHEIGAYGGVPYHYAQCDCGAAPHKVFAANLRKGASTQCAVCARKTAAQTWSKRYSSYADVLPDVEHRRRLLNRIASAIQRCGNPNTVNYEGYGHRGITVLPEWVKNRRAFLQHLLTLDGWDNPLLDMDRIDVDKGYEPGNLRFVTRAENNLNRRTVKEMQRRIDALEARLRHLERRAP